MLDLSSPRGRELLAALVSAPGPDAGILLHNRAGRSWLSDEVMRRDRPDLIHLAVEGRRDGTPALDYTVNARVGIPYMTGDVAAPEVVNHVLPAWDLLTGALASTALLAALRRRQQTGEGSYAQLALEDVAIASVADLGWLGDAQLSGHDRPRNGNFVYGTYGDVLTTSDGRHVFVLAMTDRQWDALREATDTREAFDALADALDIDLTTEESRYHHRELISAVLQRWFSARDLPTATAFLKEANALHAAYETLTSLAGELANSVQSSVVEMVRHPEIGPVLTAGSPIRWAGVPTPAVGCAPELGAHTAEVLSTVLGLNDSEIAGLVNEGIAAGPLP